MKKAITLLFVSLFLFALFALFAILLSYSVLSQPTRGTFNVPNQGPFIQANSFRVQDSPTNFDFTSPIDTHDITPTFSWIVRDPNPDQLNTSICIGTAIGLCDTLSFTFVGSFSTGNIVEYNYTGSGIAFDQSDCNLISCSVLYYVNVTVTDGQYNGSQSNLVEFLNQVPNTPSNFYPAETHNQTPSVGWYASDNDNGAQDRWPADSLNHYIKIGSTIGNSEYLNSSSIVTNNTVVTNSIPWGIPGATEARNTIYPRILAQDNYGINSSNYDTSFDLVDLLPQFNNLYLTDGAIISSTSCVNFLQPCSVNPTYGNYSSINLTFSFNDLDADCSALSHSASAVLCLVNSTSGLTCNPNTNSNFTYGLNFDGSSGNSCNFTLGFSSGDNRGIPFFVRPGTYRLYLNASSQAGISTIPINYVNWTYNAQTAISYPNSIFLGDRISDGGDGIQLGEINPGLNLSTLINQGNVANNVSWTATDASINGAEICNANTQTCWDITSTPDLQLDDDILASEGIETLLTPTNLTENPVSVVFEPFGGLEICQIFSCNSNIGERLNTTFHITPPLGLQAGDYETNITIILS